MSIHCRDCKWWNTLVVRRYGEEWQRYQGECSLTETGYSDPEICHPESLALVDGGEGGVLLTTEDFGCVQGEAKE